MINIVSRAVQAVAFPQPPSPTPPPFANGLLQLVAVVQWVALAVAIVGLVLVGGRMVMNASMGEGSRDLGAVGKWGLGMFIIAGAASIGGFVYTATAG